MCSTVSGPVYETHPARLDDCQWFAPRERSNVWARGDIAEGRAQNRMTMILLPTERCVRLDSTVSRTMCCGDSHQGL
jgi:hypothetical protein